MPKQIKKSPADYHTLAAARGFRWLGPPAPNVQTKTGWECPHGHRWQTTYSIIRRGKGCPICAGNLPKTPADYQTLARQRGFAWLGPTVPNIQTKTGWECPQGHHWQAHYNSISQGSGCPFCSGHIPKTPADYRTLAQQRGFRWTGPEAPTTKHKTGWQCPQGHHWQTSYHLIRKGTGCPVCAWPPHHSRLPSGPDDYQTLAEKHHLRWIGPVVHSVRHQTGWTCQHDHYWWATYTEIKKGLGCPLCTHRGLSPDADL
jgi:hypothetical protein